VACHDRGPNEKSPVRRVRRGATTSTAPSASYAGNRAAPNPPTRKPTRWEVVLRLHARHAVRTGLVIDKSISTRGHSGIPAGHRRTVSAGTRRGARIRSE